MTSTLHVKENLEMFSFLSASLSFPTTAMKMFASAKTILYFTHTQPGRHHTTTMGHISHLKTIRKKRTKRSYSPKQKDESSIEKRNTSYKYFTTNYTKHYAIIYARVHVNNISVCIVVTSLQSYIYNFIYI